MLLRKANGWARHSNYFEWRALEGNDTWYKVKDERVEMPIDRRAAIMNRVLAGATLILEASYNRADKQLTIHHHLGGETLGKEN